MHIKFASGFRVQRCQFRAAHGPRDLARAGTRPGKRPSWGGALGGVAFEAARGKPDATSLGILTSATPGPWRTRS